MDDLKETTDSFLKVVVNVLTPLVILGGIAVIELILRPLFGQGVPFLAELMLLTGDLTLLFFLIRQLGNELFKFLGEVRRYAKASATRAQLKTPPRQEEPDARTSSTPTPSLHLDPEEPNGTPDPEAQRRVSRHLGEMER